LGKKTCKTQKRGGGMWGKEKKMKKREKMKKKKKI